MALAEGVKIRAISEIGSFPRRSKAFAKVVFERLSGRLQRGEQTGISFPLGCTTDFGGSNNGSRSSSFIERGNNYVRVFTEVNDKNGRVQRIVSEGLTLNKALRHQNEQFGKKWPSEVIIDGLLEKAQRKTEEEATMGLGPGSVDFVHILQDNSEDIRSI